MCTNDSPRGDRSTAPASPIVAVSDMRQYCARCDNISCTLTALKNKVVQHKSLPLTTRAHWISQRIQMLISKMIESVDTNTGAIVVEFKCTYKTKLSVLTNVTKCLLTVWETDRQRPRAGIPCRGYSLFVVVIHLNHW